MANLALYERFFHRLSAVFVRFVHRRVHPAVNVQNGSVVVSAGVRVYAALILQRARLVVPFYPFACAHKIITVTRFVSQRPHYYTRPVFVAYYATLHPAQYRVRKERVNRKVAYGIIFRFILACAAVGFYVRFRYDVKAVPVAHLRKQRRVRVVARAYGVYIVPLHKRKVAQHLPRALRIACNGVIVVPVDALYLYRPAVNAEHAVFYIYLPEAYTLVYNFAAGL